MAKRRKVSAPSADDLDRIEAEFRRETPAASGALAPISQVSAESARAAEVLPAETRAAQEKDRTDAEALRAAQEDGRVIVEIPLDQIAADAMVRDRTVIDPSEMEELKSSIAAHGLRLPVEVFAMAGEAEQPYGLLSGYRRLWAVRELLALTGQDKYKSIRALVRDPDALGGSFAAMVEENEIRAQLSHYERGRIAVVAAQQGVFASVEDAVAALFRMASKAKRSKIRSFSVIFEELGDMLEFPENLKERDGLRLSNALRNGAELALRDALSVAQPATPQEEWEALAPVIEAHELAVTDTSRGGRPKKDKPRTGWVAHNTLRLSSGVTLQSGQDSDGHVIRIKGTPVNSVLVERAMEHLQYLFEKG
ncbi:ParB N-terminal domain-containing protein [uncultured Roseobacter sp.]|uniref:ParB/RepB/Spo0J family partition protein n=1 Tax=uncultured Roseobacter sp. TaxID=114847 RepID=UPI002607FEDA|nr:ParB N-terminal domain-containing protein [uncultured Roseobacter sp.]